MNIYYTYIYYFPESMIPFYVGMGHGNRKMVHLKEAILHPTPQKGKHKLNTIREILLTDKEPVISVIDSELTKDEAGELEELLIELIGRRDLGTGTLTNQTKGGDGLRGWSEARKAAMREQNLRLGIQPPSQKGRKQNRRPEYTAIPAKVVSTGERIKALLSDPRWATNEISGLNKGVAQSPEARRKNSESLARLKWWNNGDKVIRAEECPGNDFVRGRKCQSNSN